MIKSTFFNVVSDPSKIAGLSSDDLREVIHQFPYFSAAHLLLAKKLKETESLQFEKQLNITAAYVPSRKILYDLIHSATSEESSTDENVVNAVDEVYIPKVPDSKLVDELDQLIQSEQTLYKLDDTIGENPDAIEERVDLPVGNKHQFSDWLNYFEEDKALPPSQNNLIDQFITEEAFIKIKPGEDLPTENLAKKSAEDIEDYLVTETLAKIHLDQGNRMKAIEIYDRLMLKYPEKSTYFAAQIEFLKQK